MCVGQEALRIYNALPFEKEKDKANVDIVLRLMEHHCLGETNIMYERFRLNQRAQTEGETFDQYLTVLKELAILMNTTSSWTVHSTLHCIMYHRQ